MTDDWYDWFQTNATVDHGQLFVLTSWFIWKGRNAEIFMDQKWHGWQVMNLIYSNHAVVLKAFGTSKQKWIPRMVAWCPPTDNVVRQA